MKRVMYFLVLIGTVFDANAMDELNYAQVAALEKEEVEKYAYSNSISQVTAAVQLKKKIWLQEEVFNKDTEERDPKCDKYILDELDKPVDSACIMQISGQASPQQWLVCLEINKIRSEAHRRKDMKKKLEEIHK